MYTAELELLMTLSPGQKYRLYYNEGNINNAIWHIRAIVDDEYIVCRKWSKRKQSWIYFIEDSHGFWLKFNDGKLVQI